MLIKTKSGQIKEIIYNEQQLYIYGINRLSERSYARKELLDKMKKLQPDLDMINPILDKLETQGYLSDYNRAISLYNQFNGKESINKIKNRMLQKGVKKDTIEDVIAEFEEENETRFEDEDTNSEVHGAYELILKKFKSYDPEKRNKMTRFLAGKGYKYDSISKALNQLKEN